MEKIRLTEDTIDEIVCRIKESDDVAAGVSEREFTQGNIRLFVNYRVFFEHVRDYVVHTEIYGALEDCSYYRFQSAEIDSLSAWDEVKESEVEVDDESWYKLIDKLAA